MGSEAVDSTLKEVERVAKKQKTCASKTSETLSKLIKVLDRARLVAEAEDAAASAAPALAALEAELVSLDASKQLADQTKELHGAVGKLGKAVDRFFSTDVCKAARDVELDKEALNQVVAEHLYHEGQFEIGDCFVREAGLVQGEQLKRPYASMHAVLEQGQQRGLNLALAWIHQRDLGPALEWVREHRHQLGGGRPSAFEFSLHQLAFLQALQDRGQNAALAYARAHFPPFQHTHLAQIQRLMGALCFAGRGAGVGTGPLQQAVKQPARLSSGPYAHLFNLEDLWGAVARDFVRQSCALLGQAQDSPLLVTVAAGSAALPTLLKLASVVALAAPTAAELAAGGAGAGGEGEEAPSLPVEIPLGREFVFHSIFACPVSREQSSAGNPPWMLPCGHVICKQSVLKIAKAATRPFKCPYCPQEATPGQCKEIIFPDME
ncbi:hypothetical protein N2152v2_002807 [Parachlorella kessleri]